MLECSRHLNLVRPLGEATSLPLERVVAEAGYHQRILLSRLVRILEGDLLARLACSNVRRLSDCLCVCLSVCLSVYVCLSVCLSVCSSICPSVGLSVCLSVSRLSACMSICLSVCLSVSRLSACMSVCLCLSVCGVSVPLPSCLPAGLPEIQHTLKYNKSYLKHSAVFMSCTGCVLCRLPMSPSSAG